MSARASETEKDKREKIEKDLPRGNTSDRVEHDFKGDRYGSRQEYDSRSENKRDVREREGKVHERDRESRHRERDRDTRHRERDHRSVMWVVLVIVSTTKITIVVHWLTAENKRTELITRHVKTKSGREMREGRTDLISKETTEEMKAGHMKNAIETTTVIARIKILNKYSPCVVCRHMLTLRSALGARWQLLVFHVLRISGFFAQRSYCL